MTEIYKTAKDLAALFSEDVIIADCCDAFICNGALIAKEVRKEVDNSTCSLNLSGPARRYWEAERVIYGTIYNLLEGKHGYKLIKIND